MPSRHMLRDRAAGGHARVTYVELFFDLVFVFAVTQLSHGLLEHPTLLGVVETGLLLMAMWWAWIFTAWVTNWLDPEKRPVRIMLFVVMVVGMVLTMSIPKAFGERGPDLRRGVRGDPAGAQPVHGLGDAEPPVPEPQLPPDLGLVRGVGRAVDRRRPGRGGARLALWSGAIALEYVSPALGFWTPGMGKALAEEWDVEGGHLAERCALFTIIALGESILVMGATTATLAWTPMVIAAFLAAFASSLAMWWIYFAVTAEAASEAISHAKDPGRVARAAYTYIHLLPIAGIIVTAVADEWTIHHPTGHADLKTVAAMIGGPFLFLLGGVLFKRAVFHRVVAVAGRGDAGPGGVDAGQRDAQPADASNT